MKKESMLKKLELFCLAFVMCCSLLLVACGSGNLDYVKENSGNVLSENGFKIIGYEGYEFGTVIPFTRYGGAHVWYVVQRENSNVIYDVCLKRWGDEIHLYNLEALNVTAQNKQ